MKIVVLDAATLGFGEGEWAPLREFGELTLHEKTPMDDPAIIAERCEGAQVVLTNKVPLSQQTLESLADLQLVSVLATGYNVVDIDAARRCGVTVCNVAGYSTPSTAQHAVALMLELCNQCGLHDHTVQAGEWVASDLFCYWKKPVRELSAMTVGIVGFGEIGRKVGEIVNAFGASVLANQRTPRNPPAYAPFTFTSIADIFARSDIVTLHCPQTPENTGFVNAELLATMKPSAFLVNTARGPLVDEAALATALREKRIAGAAVDVVSQEPMVAGHPLLGAPNVIITPHIAWAGVESRRKLLSLTAENLRAFLGGHPVNVVT